MAVGAKAAQGFKEYLEQEVPFYQLNLEEQTDPLWEYLEPRDGCAHQQQLDRLKEPKSRRNHVAGIIGNHMVIHGGIDDFQ